MCVRQLKTALRKQMKSVLGNIPESSKSHQSYQVCKQVLASDAYKKSQRVAVYIEMKGEEVVTKSIIADMLAKNKTCFIPRYDMKSRDMDMVKVSSMEEIENLPFTKWHIKQPKLDDTSRESAMLTGGLDMLLVPGLAFTADGKRMGRGKGYYDTFLNRHKAELGRCPITMALAFREQVLDDVPVSEHDYLLDHVMYAKET